MTKRRFIRASVAVGIIAVLSVAVFLRPETAGVTLVNESDDLVVRVTGDINGATFDFADIPRGSSRKITYTVSQENHYNISAELPFDRKLPPQTGTFGDRVKTDHRFVIKDDQIVIESGRD